MIARPTEYVPGTQQTKKLPGDLVINADGPLLRVGSDGKAVPYEMPHRRLARERAERFRARHGFA